MIPKRYDKETLKSTDLQVGDLLTIKDEFKPAQEINPKFLGFLMGTIQLPNGEVKWLTVSKSNYTQISKILGEETSKWIGKKIKYEGLKMFKSMQGKSFIGVN